MLPSDCPEYADDPDIWAAYDAMASRIDEVVEKAKISRSMHFYTEDVEWTDAGIS